jgi:hypothetical protein
MSDLELIGILVLVSVFLRPETTCHGSVRYGDIPVSHFLLRVSNKVIELLS